MKAMIEDRDYRKEELARIYSPFTKKTKSALKRLRDDIDGCPELVAALEKSRWNRNRNSYTARQVRLATSDYFWLLLATKRVRECRTFVL
jgi:hypothetical protein